MPRARQKKKVPLLDERQQLVFWPMANIFDEVGCWIWRGQTQPNGYGRYAVAGQSYFAHRLAYQAFFGRLLDPIKDHRPSVQEPSLRQPFPLGGGDAEGEYPSLQWNQRYQLAKDTLPARPLV